jgi:hypothetical protein
MLKRRSRKIPVQAGLGKNVSKSEKKRRDLGRSFPEYNK